MLFSSPFSHGYPISVVRFLVDYDRLRMGEALRVEAAAVLGDSINTLLTEETDRDKRKRFAKVIVAAKKEDEAKKK